MTRGIAICKFTTAARACFAAALAAAALAATSAPAQADVYWGNYDHGRIGRAANTGTPVSPSFTDAPVGPFGVAAFEGTLYWADYDTGSIGRADVTGSAPAGVDTGFVTGQDGVFAVAVDEDHLYWGTVAGTISRAAINSDGSLGTVEPALVTGAGYVEGLAVGDDALYWSDFDGGHIGSATFAADGSIASVDTNVLTVNGAAGVAAAGNHLYWANAFGTSIGRATMAADGTLSDINQTFITGAREPAGIAVLGNEVFWTNANSTQPPKGSLSRATLAADGSVASVQHELLLDESGVFGVAIDAPVDVDAPVVTMSPVAPSSGSWFSAANSGTDGVRVDVSASDPSGVVALSCSADGATVLADTGGAPGSFTLRDGVHHVTCTATDGRRRANTGAGAGSTAFPVTLQIDQTPPSISCLTGPADWVAFNVFFRCSASDDGGSGLADPSDVSFLVSTSVPDGAADENAATGTHDVSDAAGNTETSAALHAKVDLAPPTVTCPAPAPELLQGGPATPLVATVTDSGSGPASPTATGQTSTEVVGDHTTFVAGADKVGNRTTVECAYRVVAPPASSKYVFKGLRNLHKRSFRYGSWVPLRFRLTDANGAPVRNAVARLTVVTADAGAVAASAVARKSNAPDSGDTFRHIGWGRYRYLLDTGRLPGPGTYEVRVSLDDGSVHTAPLVLKKRRGHHDH